MAKFVALAATVTVLSLSLATPGSAQPSVGASGPQDLVALFLNTIAVPAERGQPPADGVLRSFYDENLLNRTRVRVAADQFIGYWKQVGSQGTRVGFSRTITYTIGEPAYNETQDQAVVTSDVTTTTTENSGFSILTTLVTIACLATATYCAPMPIGGHSVAENLMTFVAVRDGAVWRLALPDDMVAAMAKLPTQESGTRLAANAEASENGLTLRISEVTFEKDYTTVRITADNSNDAPVNLVLAASAATLTDDLSHTYNVRFMQTQLPDAVPGKSSQTGQIAFDPVPVGTKTLVLAIPNVPVGDTSTTFRLEISLER